MRGESFSGFRTQKKQELMMRLYDSGPLKPPGAFLQH